MAAASAGSGAKISKDHGAASISLLSREISSLSSNKHASFTTTTPKKVQGNSNDSNSNSQHLEVKSPDTTPSSESETQQSSRPIPIRSATTIRIAGEQSNRPKSKARVQKQNAVESQGRLGELQDIGEAIPSVQSTDAEEVED